MRPADWGLLVLGSLLGFATPLGCSGDKGRAPREKEVETVAAVDWATVTPILERYECNRCHAGTGLEEPPTARQCVGCHRDIENGSAPGDPEQLAAWRANLHSLPAAPSLAGIGRKLRREWVLRQLQRPVDVRPALEATMPRLPLSESEARQLVEAWIPEERNQNFSEQAVSRGAELFASLNCDGCHALGARPARPRDVRIEGASVASEDARVLAPDLALVRERFQSGRLVEWLLNPEGVQPDTQMPNFHLSRGQAESLAAFLWLGGIEKRKLLAVPDRLPVLERPVQWAEVEERVFKKVCWHCHSSRELAMGDGGPGNTGGFGYRPRGLDLSSYAGIRSGSTGDDGRRRSVFRQDDSGESMLVRRLLLRQREEAGVFEELPGMPLGLPSMSPEQIQLVETWIAQGRPR